jgi:hypothetical protein
MTDCIRKKLQLKSMKLSSSLLHILKIKQTKVNLKNIKRNQFNIVLHKKIYHLYGLYFKSNKTGVNGYFWEKREEGRKGNVIS